MRCLSFLREAFRIVESVLDSFVGYRSLLPPNAVVTVNPEVSPMVSSAHTIAKGLPRVLARERP